MVRAKSSQRRENRQTSDRVVGKQSLLMHKGRLGCVFQLNRKATVAQTAEKVQIEREMEAGSHRKVCCV